MTQTHADNTRTSSIQQGVGEGDACREGEKEVERERERGREGRPPHLPLYQRYWALPLLSTAVAVSSTCCAMCWAVLSMEEKAIPQWWEGTLLLLLFFLLYDTSS